MEKVNNEISSKLVKNEQDNNQLIKTTNALNISNKIVTESLNRVSSHYKSIIIGKQEWMLENLDVTHFQNGDIILEARTNEEWQDAIDQKQPAWCYYEGNSQYNEQYGKLYNGFTILDGRDIAPKGWKVPSSEDWEILIKHLDDNKTKSNLILSTGFESFLGGNRFIDSLKDKQIKYEGLNNYAIFLSSTLIASKTGLIHFSIGRKPLLDNEFSISVYVLGLERGYSIKCLKLT